VLRGNLLETSMTLTTPMPTATLPLDWHTTGRPTSELERSGFDIGRDHAHHGLVPPAELLLEGTPVGQGWRAGRAVFGARTLAASRATRQWLALRVLAWRRGVAFELHQLTPQYLVQLDAERCPVLRTSLGGAPGHPDAAVIDRLNPHAGYAAGNLATLSRRAVLARTGVDVPQALRHARRIESGAATIDGLDGAQWLRLAALRAFATPLPFHEAVQVPLAVLPPNRVRLLNAAQGLQALLTLQFASPGWAARTRAAAEWLTEPALRHDYNLFIGALAPRVVEAGAHGVALRPALEDAWLDSRVQRRWQHFALSLGEAAVASLLDRLAAQGVPGSRLISHGADQATEGWALDECGRVSEVRRACAGTARPPRQPMPIANAASLSTRSAAAARAP
jgi:hypothetical protein